MAWFDPFRCGEVIEGNYIEPTKYCNRKVKKEHSRCGQHQTGHCKQYNECNTNESRNYCECECKKCLESESE